MKEFVNKHLTAIVGVAMVALIVIAVIAATSLNSDTKNPNTESESVTETTSEKESASEKDSSTETEKETETVKPSETESEIAPTESESTVPSESETPAPSESESTTPTEPETPVPSESESAKPSESESLTPPESEKPEEPTEPTEPDVPNEPEKPEVVYTYTGMDKTMYVKSSVNVRDLPSTDGKKLGSLSAGDEVRINGKCNETGWYRFDFRGKTAYASSSYFTDENPATKPSEDDKEDTNPSTTPSEKEPEENAEFVSGTFVINGFKLTFDYTTREGYELKRDLANAGYYNPIWVSRSNRYYMLVPKEDAATPRGKFECGKWLDNYVKNLGGDPGNGGGFNFDDEDKGYVCYVEVE